VAHRNTNNVNIPHLEGGTQVEMLTVKLFDHAPVRVVKDDWPLIASAKDWDNQYEFQANRTWTLRVRQHADGRALVYGLHTTQFQHERGREGGMLVASKDEIPAAVHKVAERLKFPVELAEECINDLPAECLR
jgi:hypothetical protein